MSTWSRLKVGAFMITAPVALVAISQQSTAVYAQGQGQARGGVGTNSVIGGDDGLTCAWCRNVSYGEWVDSVHIIYTTYHWFPAGGELCGTEGSGENNGCMRCGSVSMPCHGDEWSGWCSDHPQCGSERLAASTTALRKALRAGELKTVAAMIKVRHDQFRAEYLPASGRISLIADCNQFGPPVELAVDPELQDRLSSLLHER